MISDAALPDGSYTTSQSISGIFTSSAPLINAAGNIFPEVTSFSFNDGRNIAITDVNYSGGLFELWTDSTGAVTSWNVRMHRDDSLWDAMSGQQNYNQIDNVVYDEELAVIYEKVPDGTGSTTSSDSASPMSFETWTLTNTGNPIPEPSTLLLLGAGLVGLAAVTRRKLKK